MRTNLEVVRPAGDLLKEPHVKASVPVPLPCIIVQVNGPYTALDRKLWALLLHLAWDDLEVKSLRGKWHELEEIQVRRLIEQFSGTKDLELIWQSALRLAKTTVEYEIDDEFDDRWEGITSILSAMRKKKVSDGKFRFRFPPELVPIFKQPGRFARLHVQFLLGLKSKYAVTLYELFEGIVNQARPEIEFSIDEIRSLLKVPEDKLKKWDDIYRRAIKPGLSEINSSPEDSGIYVDHELIRGGRGNKVKAIRFKICKSKERKHLEYQIRKPKKFQSNTPQFSPSFYQKVKKYAPTGCDIYALEAEFMEWIQKTKKQPNNYEAAFMGFCKKKALKYSDNSV